MSITKTDGKIIGSIEGVTVIMIFFKSGKWTITHMTNSMYTGAGNITASLNILDVQREALKMAADNLELVLSVEREKG